MGELVPEAQIAFLRVLREKEIERVGGNRPVHVDVRVLAATNCDLSAAVASGSFRADLFYRLNVFPIKVPRCAKDEKTFRCWSSTLWSSLPQEQAGRSQELKERA